MTTTIAYRDSLEGARLRYAELLSRAGEGPSLSAVSRVYAARAGRVWAGVAGIAGAGGLVGAAIVDGLHPYASQIQPTPTLVLMLCWPLMVVAYVVGALCADLRARRVATPRRTGDVHADLARLEEADPAAEVRARARKWAWASVALPMMAVAFLAPLSLHLLVALFYSGGLQGYDKWIEMSLVIVGHAHVALAIFYAVFAAKACRLDAAALEAQRSRREWSIYGWVVLVSAVPGVVLFGLPPIITAVTALFFHPLLFRGMTGTMIKERAALA
jgi:hypothetical protein